MESILSIDKFACLFKPAVLKFLCDAEILTGIQITHLTTFAKFSSSLS